MPKKKWEKYTRDELQEMCSKSHSLTEFGKQMGYCCGGIKGIGAAKEVIQKFNLDHSSILTYDNVINGENPNKGKIDYSKFSYDPSKYKSGGAKEAIKKNLIAIRGRKCERCRNIEWNNKPIPLQLHHKDGNRANNELDNLELLCPNCHAQTDNYCRKNKRKRKVSDDEVAMALQSSKSIRQAAIKLGLSDTVGGFYNRAYKIIEERNICFPLNKEKRCIDCGERIGKNSTRCDRCAHRNKRVVNRPDRTELKRLIRSNSFLCIAKNFGVTDNAIRKWCKYYDLPYKKKDIKKYSDEEWLEV